METPKTNKSESLVPLLSAGAAIVGIAATANVLNAAPDKPAPVKPESFTEKVQESAQVPYDPRTDELKIANIRVKPGSPNKNNPSEAVLRDPEVQQFVENNPDEASSVTTSAMSMPADTREAAVVMRDVDHDGDDDAVAVPVK
jgi:hypothetical protein